MRLPRILSVALGVSLSISTAVRAQDVRVSDASALRVALKQAKAGTRIQLAPGPYGKVYAGNVRGTAEQPIIIESADPAKPAVFEGGQYGLHVGKCAHLILRNFAVNKGQANGINIDDGGDADDPSRFIVLENLTITNTGGRGNVDAIKLSGVADFTVRNCTVEAWGGSGVDMVGCHRGLIENCTFRGKEGFSQNSGVQMKGGSSAVTVRRCTFLNVTGRAVNMGGSTSRNLFRPADASWEARDLTVEGCRFAGSDAPINFIGADNCVARYNTIYEPNRWVVRILQETNAPGFVPCRNGRFENNIVVYSAGKVRSPVSSGDGTKPETFTFANNLWYARDNPSRSKPRLPSAEKDGTYNVDPRLKDPDAGDLAATAAPKGVGADALPPT